MKRYVHPRGVDDAKTKVLLIVAVKTRFLVLIYFNLIFVPFILSCLGITNKCINSYQFFVSLSCPYMFRQLCGILREPVCTFWVTSQFGFCLIKFCIVCGCTYIMWRPGAYRLIRSRPPHDIHTTTYYTKFYKQKPKLTCNSEGTDGLPEDATHLPNHVGAAKWNEKLIRIDAFVGYS
jgi:hypothetical protein